MGAGAANPLRLLQAGAGGATWPAPPLPPSAPASVYGGYDGNLVLTPMPGWTDEQLALLERPEVQDRLKPGGESVIEAPVDPDRDTAALRLACLALRQAGLWGEANFAVEVAHPRFTEAVEAAAAAGDEQQALEAACKILEGPEAAEVFGLTP